MHIAMKNNAYDIDTEQTTAQNCWTLDTDSNVNKMNAILAGAQDDIATKCVQK